MQVEEFVYQQGQLFRRYFFGVKGFYYDGCWFCNVDSVGNLNFVMIGQVCGNDVFCYIVCCVGCGMVNFRWIFIGECVVVVVSYVVVGINDDFMIGQIVVVYWVVNNEMVGWVDEEFGGCVELFGWQNWFDDFFYYCFLQGFLIDIFCVLS